MGQYRPSNLIPSTLTSDYTIDASIANNFRCKIIGTSPTIKYRLKIMLNNTASTIVYDTGVVALSTPLYPVNYDGTENELIVSVPSTSGMSNGNEYKWTIISYWSDTSFYESYENIFKAYSASTLTINAVPAVITTKTHTFSATYTQPQGVTVVKFGWILRNKVTLLESVNTIDSENIYSSELKLFYDGFLTGNTDEIKIKCWLSDGSEIETPYTEFRVEYPAYSIEGEIDVKQTYDGGALVRWSKISYIYGNPLNQNYSFKNDLGVIINSQYLQLEAGNSVTFDQVTGSPMSFSTNSTHVVNFTSDIDNPSVYRATGTNASGNAFYIELQYLNGSIILNVNGTQSTIYTRTANDAWFCVVIEPKRVRVVSYSGDGTGLYPSPTLYPSLTLYPRGQGYIGIEQASVVIDIPSDGTYSRLVVSGYQKINYLWVIDGNMPDAYYSKVKNTKYEPTWSPETIMLATFNGNFSAGNTTATSTVYGWWIYRLDVGAPTLKFIKYCVPSKTFCVDYSIKNQVECTYYVFPVFTTDIGVPNISKKFSADWWDWDLIVCKKIDEKTYTHISTHKFDLDVSTGAMNNNTAFNVLDNFTKYSKIQASNTNYWTGTITSLLGNCADYYSDTVSQMASIKALTTDGNEKFLKDRKGNFWKVLLNSPISEEIIDEYKEQAIKIDIGWMEVGNSSLCSITEPDDAKVSDVNIDYGVI